MEDTVEARYLELGLAIGRHIDGFVDAYFGPPEIAARVEQMPIAPPAKLADEARRLLADVDGSDLAASRRHFLAGQVRGLRTTAAKLAGEAISYSDEVESSYGVRPQHVPEDVFAEAHARLDAALPGSGPLAERLNGWRETQAVPPDKLQAAVSSLADDLRERTQRMFGLPDGEHVDFELVTNQPWSGFNYFLGDLQSRVAINTDLPVLSPTLAQLVAHESYPGHHTEHSRKEVGLVRRRKQLEETIFLVGTPQCLVAEGLADLGLEVVVSTDAHARAEFAAAHLAPLGIPYDTDIVATVQRSGDGLGYVRGNVALLLHEEGADLATAIAYMERWALLPRKRAEKAVEFLTDPTWRAYMTCYVEGLPLCRAFVNGDPARFERLITEQLTPDQLIPA
ncbi:MAG: hypothetical protein QOI47_2159 [Actinomycetota bacterium]|jgi:hypothetical protein|nr:hypothetical protein [Actinomycetota bacterium]